MVEANGVNGTLVGADGTLVGVNGALEKAGMLNGRVEVMAGVVRTLVAAPVGNPLAPDVLLGAINTTGVSSSSSSLDLSNKVINYNIFLRTNNNDNSLLLLTAGFKDQFSWRSRRFH